MRVKTPAMQCQQNEFLQVVLHILKKYIVAKGCKLTLRAFNFAGISNRNRVLNNRSLLNFGSTKSKYGVSCCVLWKRKT
jgi:hypothetical protein